MAHAGDDYYQNLKTYMASESGPTVFTLNSASEIAEMSGYLADLSDLEVMGKVQENLIAMVDGKKTGVPMTAEGFGIIYNKDMVDPEAISTMDGLIAFIEEQKAAGRDRPGPVAGRLLPHWPDPQLPLRRAG